MRFIPLFAAAALLACSPTPAPKSADAPPATKAPAPPSCNALTPDFAKLVTVEDEAAAALPAAGLAGGPIAPGDYDLIRAVRIGAATGWPDARAIAVTVSENADGATVLDWAGASEPGAPIDTWTATLSDAPETSITYTCGRSGQVHAAYAAGIDTLELRIDDGAGGALHMIFAKRD